MALQLYCQLLATMRLQGARDEDICCAFTMIIEKEACVWYHNLPPGSIDEFDQLQWAFIQ